MCSTGFDFTRVCMCACTSYCRLRLAYVHRRWGGPVRAGWGWVIVVEACSTDA